MNATLGVAMGTPKASAAKASDSIDEEIETAGTLHGPNQATVPGLIQTACRKHELSKKLAKAYTHLCIETKTMPDWLYEECGGEEHLGRIRHVLPEERIKRCVQCGGFITNAVYRTEKGVTCSNNCYRTAQQSCGNGEDI